MTEPDPARPLITIPRHRTAPPRTVGRDTGREDLLVRALPAPGTLVSITAPLGFGKTTLAAHVARSMDVPVAWLTADRLDADPSRLWSGLLAAVGRAVSVDIPTDVVPTIASGDERWWEAAAALAAALEDSASMLIVLDNMDDRRYEPVQAGLDYLIECLPEQHSLLLTGRRTLPATRAGLLAPERLQLISTFDLRLDDELAGDVLRQLAPDLPRAITREIVSFGDGWPLALVLAARCATDRPQSDWRSDVAEALLDHVLADAPRAEPAILAMSALSPVTAEAATALGMDSQAWAQLRDAGLLLPAAGGEGGWRLPGPIGSAADRRLRATDPDRHGALHADAAQAAIQIGHAEEAMGHLMAAGDIAAARAALHRVEDTLFLDGRGTEAQKWYRQLYDGTGEASLDRLIRAAWSATLTCRHDEAERIVQVLRESMSSHRWTSDRVAGEVLVLRATLAGRRGRLDEMESYGRRAVLAFGDEWSTNGRVMARVVVARAAFWSEDGPALRAAHDELVARADLPEYFANGVVVALTAGVALAAGRLREAIHLGRLSHNWLLEHPVPSSTVSSREAEVTLAAGLTESGVEPDARSDLIDLARFADEHELPLMSVLTRLHAARASLLEHEYRPAFETLAGARGIALEAGASPRLLSRLDQLEVPLALQVGDVTRARAAAQRLPAGNSRTLLQAAVAQVRRPASATRALEVVVPDGPRQDVQRRLLLARALMINDRRSATTHLAAAAALAQKHGLMLSLRTSAPALIDFAHEAAIREADAALAELVRFATPEPGYARTVAPPPAVSLSPGERQLLALLPTRLRYDGIAAALGVSVNTVKSRLKRLYAKLEASSRDEALSRARQRGLIAEDDYGRRATQR
ncbi:MAG: hypothetical protein RLZ55_552 [Actinomycetota bacterium]